jgi:hypothetical protein
MEQQSARRLSLMRLGGWSASVSGTIGAIGLVLWFARFAFPGGPVGWFNDLLTGHDPVRTGATPGLTSGTRPLPCARRPHCLAPQGPALFYQITWTHVW